MRKIILQEWITLDGYASDTHGGMDFFTSPEFNEESDRDLLDGMATIDTILLGAKTYRIFADYWPSASTATEIIAERLNNTPKFVFSGSLEAAPWGKWPPATVIRENPVVFIRRLLRQPGKNVVIWGSLTLAQALMRENMIDEYQLRVCPVILGAGRPLFPAGADLSLELALQDVKKYRSGMALLRYSRKP